MCTVQYERHIIARMCKRVCAQQWGGRGVQKKGGNMFGGKEEEKKEGMYVLVRCKKEFIIGKRIAGHENNF